jgi:PhnB protein
MIIPMLVCRDAAVEIDFCRSILLMQLNFIKRKTEVLCSSTLRIGEAMFMVHGVTEHLASRAPQLDGSSPVVIYLYGEEVDTVIERAVTNGARILLPAADQFWGDRVGRIIDPEGHVWNIATRINEE